MRRALLVPVISAALLLTASCGSEDPDQPTVPATSADAGVDTGTDEDLATSEATASESPTTPPATTTTTAPPATPTDTTPPEEPTESASDSPTTTEAAPPPPPPEEPGECSSGAYDAGPLDPGDAPGPVVDTATVLLDAAVACDSATLIARATADGTSLSFGGGAPEELLGLPDVEGRYLALAVLLSGTSPTTETIEGEGEVTTWPAAFAEGATDADWQEIVDAGLYTQAEVDQMRGGGGYHGWRVGIAEDGAWQFFIAGD